MSFQCFIFNELRLFKKKNGLFSKLWDFHQNQFQKVDSRLEAVNGSNQTVSFYDSTSTNVKNSGEVEV